MTPCDLPPPCDILAEACLLGAMLVKTSVIPSVSELVTDADFFRPAHQILFRAMVKLSATVDNLDVVLLKSELEKRKQLDAVGGVDYIVEATNVPDAWNWKHYAQIVKDKAVKRALLSASVDLARRCREDGESADELVAAAETHVYHLSRRDSETVADVREVTAGVIESATNPKAGLRLGIPNLDAATGGLRPGNYFVIAARPKVGKTFLALNIAARLAERGEAVLFVSCEMSKAELAQRLLCSKAGVSLSAVRNGRLAVGDAPQLESAKAAIDKYRLRIDERSFSIPKIAASVRRMKAEVGQPALVIVDYFQLLTGEGKGRYDMFSNISRDIKLMLKDLGIPGVVLSQFRRPQQGQEARKPSPEQMKETGALEQDVDFALLLHNASPRDEYETKDIWGALELNRHGPSIWWPDEGTRYPIRFSFDTHCGRMTNNENAVSTGGDNVSGT